MAAMLWPGSTRVTITASARARARGPFAQAAERHHFPSAERIERVEHHQVEGARQAAMLKAVVEQEDRRREALLDETRRGDAIRADADRSERRAYVALRLIAGAFDRGGSRPVRESWQRSAARRR